MNLVPQVSADEVATRPDKTTNSESIWAKTAVTAYLREHVKEFCYLGELRAKVSMPWESLVVFVPDV